MYNPNIWWHFFQFAFLMIWTSLFVFQVFEHKLKVRAFWFWVLMVLYIFITSCIIALTLTEISPYGNFSSLGILIITLLSIGLLKSIIQKNGFSLLFLFFLFLNIQYNTILLAEATLDYSFIQKPFDYLPANMLLLSSIYGIFLLPILYYLLVKLYKRLIDEDISFKGMELFFCLPAGFFLFICLLMLQIRHVSIAPGAKLFPLIVFNTCAFGSYFSVLKSVLVAHDVSVKQQELYDAHITQLLLEDQCEILQAKITSDARMRHDWNHHFITIMGFVDKQDLPGLGNYLTEYKDKYMFPDAPPICNINALDMLFQYYKRSALELNINLTINAILLDLSHIAVSDLIVVFGNLLANAVEACERMTADSKFITLKIRNREKNIIAIICENSFDGLLLEKGSTFQSRKKDGGLGLSSIEAVVKKNNGVLEFKISKQIFKVYVALHT